MKFKHQYHLLDYSNIGNEQTMMNINTQAIPIKVHERFILRILIKICNCLIQNIHRI